MNVTEPGKANALLLEIQDLDTELQALRREIAGLAVKHRLDELRNERERLEESLAAKMEELEGLEKRQHKLDGELDLLSKKIKTEEEKLFSGTIMNSKELSAIQSEIISLKKKRDEMETEDLEMMESIDALNQEAGDLKGATGRTVEAEQAAHSAYDEELAEKESRVAVLEVRRDGLKEGLDPDVVTAYDRLLREKGGLAVARMERGRKCGGCNIEFSRTQIDRFQHEEGIFRCDYCRRILVR